MKEMRKEIRMEYLFFGCGIIYFILAAICIVAVPIIEFLLTIILSIYWSIKEVKEVKKD